MQQLKTILARVLVERGQTMAEYAILIGVIALIVIVAALALGGNISSVLNHTSTKL